MRAYERVEGQKCLRCPSGWSYFPDTDHCYIRVGFLLLNVHSALKWVNNRFRLALFTHLETKKNCRIYRFA
uniref:Uncharacterized protein n=1 Tax=Parascaris equorum TaxID=6256 RepID=A0A914S0G6_PAREQ